MMYGRKMGLSKDSLIAIGGQWVGEPGIKFESCFRPLDVMFGWSPQLSTISINGDIMMMVYMSDLLM